MASTNKTANLGLNQWEAADPVEREDFNADNAKLDAAISKRLEWVLMGEYVREDASGTSSFSLDVSGYDLSEYLFVAISFPRVNTYAEIYLNSVTDTYVGYVDDGSVCFMLTMKDGDHYPVLISARRGQVDSRYARVFVKDVKTIMVRADGGSSFGGHLKAQVWGIK